MYRFGDTAFACPSIGKDTSAAVQPMSRSVTILRWLNPFNQGCLCVALLMVSLTCLPVHGQNITADVLGTVTDPNGSVVSDATVTIQNTDTNAQRSTKTNDNGEFIFNLLPVGNYSLSIEAAGFKPYRIVGFMASAGARLRMDATLQVGASTQTIEVQSSAAA